MKIKSDKNFIFNAFIEKNPGFFSRNTDIKQNIISYKNKFKGFVDALKKIEKEDYLNYLINEGIDTFEGENTIDCFLLLFSRCNNQQKYLYKLFLTFPKEFKLNLKIIFYQL